MRWFPKCPKLSSLPSKNQTAAPTRVLPFPIAVNFRLSVITDKQEFTAGMKNRTPRLGVLLYFYSFTMPKPRSSMVISVPKSLDISARRSIIPCSLLNRGLPARQVGWS